MNVPIKEAPAVQSRDGKLEVTWKERGSAEEDAFRGIMYYVHSVVAFRIPDGWGYILFIVRLDPERVLAAPNLVEGLPQ